MSIRTISFKFWDFGGIRTIPVKFRDLGERTITFKDVILRVRTSPFKYSDFG